jgi:hypothetical protein
VKVNRIELDKNKGLTIQVDNGFQKQTIFLDGEKVTITVEGMLGSSSTIEQTPTSITLNADEFIVNAKTITMNAELEASMSAGAIPVPVVPKKIGDKLKDKLGAKIADQIAAIMPTKPDLLPGPTRISLLPAAASVVSPAIEALAEANVTVLAPTVTVTGVEVMTVSAPAGVVAVTGLTVNVAGEAGFQAESPNIALVGANIALGGNTTVIGGFIIA